jgi:type I restriction enzyme S subunit
VFAHGSTMQHILKSDFDNLEIETPPLAEQVDIATYLDEKTAQIDRIVSAVNSKIEKLKDLRKALISDAVTGKIKVVSEGQAS